MFQSTLYQRFPYLAALRPHQWTKNLVVFAAPIFAFHFTRTSLFEGVFGFGLFCALSSSFYLLNDIADVQSDRQHPVKCQRPIASGAIPIPVAIALSIALMGIALSLGWVHSTALGLTLTAYGVLQVGYNLKLKQMPILDIAAIATGFILRAYAGAAATNVPVSHWFLLCTGMLALFLGIEKRKAELYLLDQKGGKTRAVLKHYSLPLLQRMESIVTNGAVMSYALWSTGPIANGASTRWMLLTLPFVLYGIFRYQFLSDPHVMQRQRGDRTGRTERPDEILLHDLPILITVVAWISTILVILWLQQRGIIT